MDRTVNNDLTQGSILKTLIRFSIPYFISCFLQALYGLTDLFVIGQFNDASVISAVSVGSQVTHMLTVIIVGLAMGSTVIISNAVGAKETKRASKAIGNTVSVFLLFSLAMTVLPVLFVNGILNALSTPAEAMEQARIYLIICFCGVPFIVAYNVLSSVFRGLGDSKSPMYFVAVAGVINIALDFIFIGSLKMQAAGAALATALSQAVSVIFALVSLKRRDMGVKVTKKDFGFGKKVLSDILKIGVPVAFQDGFIQIAFLVITAIANGRGVDTAAAVGIVEKIIGFLFLVPSSMLSSISAIAAQNAGAELHKRGSQTLFCGMGISVAFGVVIALICQCISEPMIGAFAKETEVITLGGQYLRAYVFDCIFAGIHFCFSGYFCAYGKSMYSFAHNLISIVLIRVPAAYMASKMFADTLYPMGLAAPLGSLLSALLCTGIYLWFRKKKMILF